MRTNTKKWTMLAMLSAAAYAVMLLSKQIPINILGFLNFDLKDAVICIAGFLFGAVPAALISVLVSVLEMITVSATGLWGLLMNVLSTCAFACTAAFIYHKNRTMNGAVVGLISGALLMTAAMLLWNFLITPIYMGYPRQAVAELLLPIFLPFNLIKAGINAALTMLLYKPIVTALRKANLIAPSNSAAGRKYGTLAVSFVLLITFALLALVLAGVI